MSEGSTFRSRYECKYLIDPATVEGVRRFIRPFARPDRYAARSPDRRYAISSLYLDSRELFLYGQTVGGEANRFKLRVRTYSDDPASPAFFEVKKKINAVVSKRRAGLSRTQARALLEGGSLDFLDDLPDRAREDLQCFRNYARVTGARPVARVKYMREAYEARSNEPVRITFDTHLQSLETRDGNLSHRDERWIDTPTDGVVLEIKFTARLPGWAQELVREFSLQKRPVPKYVLAVDRMRERPPLPWVAPAQRVSLPGRT